MDWALTYPVHYFIMKINTHPRGQFWARVGMRFLPFADAVSAELSLLRLLRLSLFQISFGMATVLLVGTLNRVMIVEMKVPVSLVSLMIAIPLLAAPFRALIGYRSDNHRSELGWRRVPYLWMGTLIQFGGFAIMPFALLVLSGAGQSSQAPAWVGQLGAAFAFLLVGAGMHTTQTVGLALATDLAPAKSQPQVVGLMYVMQLIGMIVSAMVFGDLLTEYSPGRLIQVIQGVALLTMVLNVTALWKQEARSRQRQPGMPVEDSFTSAWAHFCQGPHTHRRLIAVGLGTMAFTMQDVLLEPYGGEVLHMSVSATTSLTATIALGGLLGFTLASEILGRGSDPYQMASWGAMVGIPGFIFITLAAQTGWPWLFSSGTCLIGFGGGLFAHGTLTATMQLASKEQTGLAMGAWGAVQATAVGLAIVLGGVIRDSVAYWTHSAVWGYSSVYILESVLLILTLIVMAPMLRVRQLAESASWVQNK